MSNKIKFKGKAYLYKQQFDKLVEENRLVSGVEYCIIDDNFIIPETLLSTDWSDVEEGNYTCKIVTKTKYSDYSLVRLLGSFDVGKYGIVMHSVNENGNVVIYAINKPADDITIRLEVHK